MTELRRQTGGGKAVRPSASQSRRSSGDAEWTMASGLQRVVLSLLWRTALAGILWCGGLWVFHAALGGIGVQNVPLLIAIGFSALCGSVAGAVLGRGLDEAAGFVSPMITLLAAIGAAVAIIGGEALFANFFEVATNHLRFIIVGVTMTVALGWIVNFTIFDS